MSGYVYVAASPAAPGRFKVGFSRWPERRIAHLNFVLIMLGLPPLVILCLVSGPVAEARALEREVHHALAKDGFQVAAGQSREMFGAGVTIEEIARRIGAPRLLGELQDRKAKAPDDEQAGD